MDKSKREFMFNHMKEFFFLDVTVTGASAGSGYFNKPWMVIGRCGVIKMNIESAKYYTQNDAEGNQGVKLLLMMLQNV